MRLLSMIGGYFIRRLRPTQYEVITARMPISHVVKAHLIRPLRQLMSGLRFHFHSFQHRRFRRLLQGLLVNREDVGVLRVICRLLFQRSRLVFQLPMDQYSRVFRVPILRRFGYDFGNSRFKRLHRVGAMVIKVTGLQEEESSSCLLQSRAIRGASGTLFRDDATGGTIISGRRVISAKARATMYSIVCIYYRIVPTVTLNGRDTRFSVFSDRFLQASATKRGRFRFVIVQVVSRTHGLPRLLFVRVVIRPLGRAMGYRLYHVQSRQRGNVIRIVVGHFRSIQGRFLARLFSLLMGVHIATSQRMSPLRQANFLLPYLVSLYHARLSLFASRRNLSQRWFPSFSCQGVRYHLGRQAFKDGRHGLIVLVPRHQAGPPQIARYGTLSTANRSTRRVPSIPFFAQHTRRINGISIILGMVHRTRTNRTFDLDRIGRAFRFAIRPIPRLFRRGVHVNVLAKVLTSNYSANGGFVRVNRIRIATGDGVLHPPIVSSRGQVGVKCPKFSNDQMARVPRVDFSNGERHPFNGHNVIRLFFTRVLRITLCYLGCLNSNAKARYPLARRVLLAQVYFRFRAHRANAFLAAIVLLFRRRVRLVRPMRPHSMLLFVMLRQFGRACRNGTAFVFRLFRLFSV